MPSQRSPRSLYPWGSCSRWRRFGSQGLCWEPAWAREGWAFSPNNMSKQRPNRAALIEMPRVWLFSMASGASSPKVARRDPPHEELDPAHSRASLHFDRPNFWGTRSSSTWVSYEFASAKDLGHRVSITHQTDFKGVTGVLAPQRVRFGYPVISCLLVTPESPPRCRCSPRNSRFRSPSNRAGHTLLHRKWGSLKLPLWFR
jgi:hypothetical protein